MPTPPMPGWNEPVATGRRSPILSDAFWLSSARICGLWISLVSESPITAERLAEGIETWKLVALRLARLFRLIPLVVPEPVVDVVVLVEVVAVVLLMLLCRLTVALVGGLRPRVRDRSLLICITSMSMMTSGRALS